MPSASPCLAAASTRALIILSFPTLPSILPVWHALVEQTFASSHLLPQALASWCHSQHPTTHLREQPLPWLARDDDAVPLHPARFHSTQVQRDWNPLHVMIPQILHFGPLVPPQPAAPCFHHHLRHHPHGPRPHPSHLHQEYPHQRRPLRGQLECPETWRGLRALSPLVLARAIFRAPALCLEASLLRLSRPSAPAPTSNPLRVQAVR